MSWLDAAVNDEIVAAMVQAMPNEGCGLLIGRPFGTIDRFVAIDNANPSPVTYRLDDYQYLSAVTEAEAGGFDIVGVVHSHPNSPAIPSETDIEAAMAAQTPSNWLWVIVSLSGADPVTRVWRIVEGRCHEVADLIMG